VIKHIAENNAKTTNNLYFIMVLPCFGRLKFNMPALRCDDKLRFALYWMRSCAMPAELGWATMGLIGLGATLHCRACFAKHCQIKHY
jgi:hypothetical protein